MIQIGIISDTHLPNPTSAFEQQCQTAFSRCEMIIHAGDLTDISLLSIFRSKEIHAVCGNSCNRITRMSLPEEKVIIVEGYMIAVTHGTGPRHNIEERVFEKFSEAACIIFGHSHKPACHTFGKTLMINPGSFQSTGRYGSPGTYAILQIDGSGLKAKIHTLSEPI